MGSKKQQNRNSKNEKSKTILSDHKRIGERFVPPMAQLGSFQERSWIKTILPELIWLGLLNDRHGVKRGAELALVTTKSAIEAIGGEKRWFAPISVIGALSAQEKKQFLEILTANGDLEDIQEALAELVFFYPDCPLQFLFKNGTRIISSRQLQSFKSFLSTLFDKTGKDATFIQAIAIYIAFVCDLMFVPEGSILAEFPKIQEYPHTMESKTIAAAVRASVPAFFGATHFDHDYTWSDYFWNRGLELEPCELRSNGYSK